MPSQLNVDTPDGDMFPFEPAEAVIEKLAFTVSVWKAVAGALQPELTV